MKKEVGGIAAIIIVIIVIGTIIFLGPWNGSQNPYYNPQESLPHLAAPAEVPGEHVNATVVGNLNLSVTGFFHTISLHNSPSTFDFTIDVMVNNTGTTVVDDFHVVKVTMFNENGTPIYTFGVVPDGNFTIPGNSEWENDYTNDRDMVESPLSYSWADDVFARVLVTFNGDTSVILTTPLTMLLHAFE